MTREQLVAQIAMELHAKGYDLRDAIERAEWGVAFALLVCQK